VSAIALATSTGLQQGGGHDIAFDLTSSVVGGKTQGIYATSYGTGVYHSTDGGQTWTLTSGTPTLPEHMVVAQDGVVYVTNNDASSNLYKYSSGAWSTANVGGTPVNVAVDPANANRIVVSEGGGSLSASSNHGASFTGFPASLSFTSTDIPWLAWALTTDEHTLNRQCDSGRPKIWANRTHCRCAPFR
jgi:xyloglucan-specific exo-beta-1,4-glucanase